MRKFSDYLTEKRVTKNVQEHVDDFVSFACDYLDIECPEITLYNDKKLATENKSFGGYHPSTQEIKVNIAERHRADVFRTLAHELVHYKQHLDDRLDEDSGNTGSDQENEANAIAGIIMRNYARANEKLFEGYDLNIFVMRHKSLHEETTPLEHHYADGKDAFHNDVPKSKNPHPRNSMEREAWKQGHEDAASDHKAFVKKNSIKELKEAKRNKLFGASASGGRRHDSWPTKNDHWQEDEKDYVDYLAKRHHAKIVKTDKGYHLLHPSSPGIKTKRHFDNSDDFRYDLK